MTELIQQAAPLLAQGLAKTYGRHTALENISLRLEAGTIVGLVGRNGAGKSTLLECLLGLRPADSGQVRLFGKTPQAIDDADKALIGYVPQRPDGFDWMTVDAMLDLMADLYSTWDSQLAGRLKKDWGVDGRRSLLTLSPGQRQQVAIIRAMAPRPRLLVLDEPASALDPLARRTLLREIVDLAGEQDCTVLFSTHIISDLERVASHIALLHQGRLRLHAALDELKEELRRLAWPGSIEMPPQPLPGELARRRLDDGSWALVVRDVGGAGAGVWPVGVRAHALTLEDLFVELAA